MQLRPHVVTQGTTQCRPPPGPGSRTPGRSPAVGPLRDDREATVLPKPRAAPLARGHGDGLSSMGQLRGHQARPGFGHREAPLPRRTRGPPGASRGSLIRAASPAPSARSDGVRARRQPRLGRRGRSESSRHQRPRCQAGERPPSLPLAPLPAASARPGSVPAAPRAVMCPGCWRPAGQGACPPCPLGTPRILRNVRVCARALDSFKGKSLSLCRIPYQPLRLAARWGLGGGVHRDPRPRAALQRVPSFGEELWAERAGWGVSPTRLQVPP